MIWEHPAFNQNHIILFVLLKEGLGIDDHKMNEPLIITYLVVLRL